MRACRVSFSPRRRKERRENAEEFSKNFNDSLRSLCVLGVSAVNARAHIMWGAWVERG